MNLNIYLIDPVNYSSLKGDIPTNGTTGLLWVQEALAQQRIDSQIFPTSEKPETIGEVIETIISSEEDNVLTVVGFSTTDETLNQTIELSRYVKDEKPDIITIAGGPSFTDPEYNKKFLEQGHFDGINSGHCMPFVEAMVALKNNKFEINNWSMPYDLLPDLKVGVSI